MDDSSDKEIPLEVLESIFGEEIEREKRIIQFVKKGDKSYSYQSQVEALVERESEYWDSYRESPRGYVDAINSLNIGISELKTRLYEIPNKGVLLYTEANTLEGYMASVTLLGFDEETEFYKKLKQDFLDLSEQGDVDSN